MKRPNILLLYTDQQRWDALGAAGNPEIQTPNLDRLAAQGVCFPHHYVQCPVCMPSRLSLLTGKYPSTFGILNNGVPVPPDTRTIAHILANYGYHRANIGKLHFLNHANRDHREPHPPYGFDHLEISDEPGCYEDAYRAWARRKDPSQMNSLSVGLPPATSEWQRIMGVRDGIHHPQERQPARAIPFPGRPDMTHSAFVAEQTIQYIRSRTPERPFFCIAGFYSPHSPWVVPQQFLDQYDPARLTLPPFPENIDAQRPGTPYADENLRSVIHGYYAMVTEVDHCVGRILDTLEEKKIADDTIVVFTSDHGEWLGEHMKYGKGAPGHDSVTRTPLLLRWPAALGAPARRPQAFVEAVDLLPTLLEWAAIPVPPDIQGRSFAPLAQGDTHEHRQSAFSEIGPMKILRTPTHRYCCDTNGKELLFDTTTPLGEYRNLADNPAHAQTLSEHRRLMTLRLIEKERPTPRTWSY